MSLIETTGVKLAVDAYLSVVMVMLHAYGGIERGTFIYLVCFTAFSMLMDLRVFATIYSKGKGDQQTTTTKNTSRRKHYITVRKGASR